MKANSQFGCLIINPPRGTKAVETSWKELTREILISTQRAEIAIDTTYHMLFKLLCYLFFSSFETINP